MTTFTKRRAAAGASLVALAAVCGVPLSSSTAFAAPAGTVNATRYIQMEVVNRSAEKTDLQFYSKNTEDKGWTKGIDRGGIPALPSTSAVEGNSRAAYSVAMTGLEQSSAGVTIWAFDNYFNVRATSSGTSGDATVGTIEAKKDYSTYTKGNETNELKVKGEGNLKLKFEVTSPDSKDFAAKYRLIISDSSSTVPDKDAALGPAVTHSDPAPNSTFDIGRSDLKIDVPGASKDPNKQLQLWQYNGSLAQQWKIVDTKAGEGYYQIRNAGNDLCLEIAGANPKAGAPVQQYQCDPNEANQANQLWKFVNVGANPGGPNGYRIVSKTGLAIDVHGGMDAIMSGAALVAGSGLSWSFQTPVNNVGGKYRQAIDSLLPNTDYKMQSCSSINGADTRPSKLEVNGREYTWGELTSSDGNWVTTNSHGQVLFDSPSSYRAILCWFRPALGPSPKITRLTGDSVKSPVYRVDLPEQTRVYDTELPADIPLQPYTVEGFEQAKGTWRPVGKVMPISAPKMDRTEKRATFGAASFYFENTPDEPEVSKLRISGLGRGAREVALASATQPPNDLLLSYGLEVQGVTKQPVTANGLAQEPLRLAIKNGDKPISPSDPRRLYDYVYFRDQNKALITNLFKEGGYTTITPVKGAYVNAMPGIQAANDPIVYLSTTKKDAGNVESEITAHLDTSPILSVDEALVDDVGTRAVTTGTPPGTALSGISPFRGAADPNSGALYYPDNGKTARAGILTRFEALTAADSLPARPAFWGYFTLYSGGSILRLNSDTDLNDTTAIEAFFVSGDGTFNHPPKLPK